MRVSAGDWCYSLDHDEPGRVIAVDVVWGEETALVWLARRDAVLRLQRGRLQPLAGAEHAAGLGDLHEIVEVLVVHRVLHGRIGPRGYQSGFIES